MLARHLKTLLNRTFFFSNACSITVTTLKVRIIDEKEQAKQFPKHLNSVFQPNNIQTDISLSENIDSSGVIKDSTPLEVAKLVNPIYSILS